VIEEGLLKSVPLRSIAQQTNPRVSAWSIHRHRQHLPAQLALAARAVEASAPSELLDRVEKLIEESQGIVTAAKAAKNWQAATGALREARACLELLGKLNGELQAASNVSLHKHLHLEAAHEAPGSVEEIDLEIARGFAEVTDNFSVEGIARLKRLVQGDLPALLVDGVATHA